MKTETQFGQGPGSWFCSCTTVTTTVHETESTHNKYFTNVKQTNKKKQGHFMDPNFGRLDCQTIIFYLSLFPKMTSRDCATQPILAVMMKKKTERVLTYSRKRNKLNTFFL